MNRRLKIFFILTTIVLLGLTGICSLAYKIINQSLPLTKGKIELPGLDRPVYVYRDGYNIPHILAESEYSLFYSQGYTTAQDRLWQMDISRRYARGKLSNILGAEALPLDSLMLTIGLGKISDEMSLDLSTHSKNIYQAYTDGINGYLKTRYNKLPLEFILLNYRPALWKVSDCIAVYKLWAWSSNAAWRNKLSTASIIAKTGYAEARKFYSGPVPVKGITKDDTALFLNLLNKSLPRLPGLKRPAIESGGQSWAVSGRRSLTGLPLLAGSPHNSLTLPGVWYENHIHGAGFDVYGLSLPGHPGIISGSNRNIAWSLTPSGGNNLDFIFTEKPLGLKIRSERIPVRMDSARTLKIETSHQGPVMSNLVKKYQFSDRRLIMHWTGLAKSDDLTGIIGLNEAKNWPEFQEAAKHLHAVPAQLLYADIMGNIGSQAAGDAFKQVGESNLQPFEALYSQYNPAVGFISASVTRRLKMDGFRPVRNPVTNSNITELLNNDKFIAVKDLKKLHANIVSAPVFAVNKKVISLLNDQFKIGTLYRSIYNKLTAWDGSMHAGSGEAVFSYYLNITLARHLFMDKLGPKVLFDWLNNNSAVSQAVYKRLEFNSEKKLVQRCFTETADSLARQQGDFREWSWGAIHRLTFNHLLGSNPLIGRAFNLGPFPMNGAAGSLDSYPFALKEKSIIQGTSARYIFDLGRRDNSLCIIAAGQSGQPHDEHYKDQLVLYREHLYHPVLTDTTRIKRSGMNLLILQQGQDNDK